MSLLEDVFLQDEANEAEELERVIEGDEFEERRRSDSDENSEKEDEAEEDKRKVDPKQPKTAKVVKNPRFLLNPARLTGPRGIQVIPEHFKDFKFKGKGYEKDDLDLVLKRLEHWAYRLYPKFQFEDCLKKIEMLGKKRPVAVHLHKIRSDQFLSEDTVVQKDSSDEETAMPVQEEDEFDKLLQQQIDLARSTPGPNSAKKPARDGSISPKDKRTTSLMMPKATSSPSINDEQRERMLRSRKLAEERRLARLKNAANTVITANSNLTSVDVNPSETNESNRDTDDISINKKHSRLNVIDSSDEETTIEMCVSTTVDVHTASNVTDNVGVVPENRDITINNSRLEINEVQDADSKEKIQEMSKEVDNSISHINNGCDNVDLINDVSEKSDENVELRYDDSDGNINLNELNTLDKSSENMKNDIEKVSDTEPNERLSSDMGDTSKVSDKKASNTTEIISNTETNLAPVSDDVIHNKNDKINVASDEIPEDIMDVDFSDDF